MNTRIANLLKNRPSLSAFIVLVLLPVSVLLSTARQSMAMGDADKETSDYKANLEANVDLKKKSDNKRQSYSWLLDENGKEIKALDYLSVAEFAEGMAAVTDHHPSGMSGTGYVNTDGALVIPIQFANSRNFSGGFAWVWTQSGADGYINRDGQQVIKNRNFYEGEPFSEGLAAVRVRMSGRQVDDARVQGEGLPGKWGFIDKTGKITIAPKYAEVKSFHQGLAAVKRGSDWLFIDRNGTEIGDKYQMMGSFSEDLAPVEVDGKWGYVTKIGKIAVGLQYEDARDFAEDLAAVKSGGRFGFINASGKFIIEPTFDAVDHFSESLCAVRANSGKWGFIDQTGKLVVPAAYDDAQAFSSGRGLVKVAGKFGFIDNAGRYVVQPKYDYASAYSGKRAVVSSMNWNHPIMRDALMSIHLTGLKVHEDASSPTKVYIPKDLDDAVKELDDLLPEPAKDDIRIVEKSDMICYHHGFGTWLRNNWGLWKGLRLAQYFNSIGIHHPDDMSSTILNAYWSKLHRQPVGADR